MIYRADYIFPIDREPIINGYVEVDKEGTILSCGSADSLDTNSRSSAEYLKGILIPGFAIHIVMSNYLT